MRSFSLFLLTSIFSLLLFSCETEADKGWAPVARLTVYPSYVPIGITTEIELDGHKSCDALDNPALCDSTEDGDGTPSVCPGGITYEWDVPGAVSKIESLNSNNSRILANVNIQRATKISLTITDCDGLTATKYVWLGVTKP